MRADLRKSGTEYKVTKNSILRFAAKEAKLDELEGLLEGPTAIAFSYEDYVEPAKVLYDYAKTSEFYKIKGGVMDGKVISVEEIERLAREEGISEVFISALSLNIDMSSGRLKNFANLVFALYPVPSGASSMAV